MNGVLLVLCLLPALLSASPVEKEPNTVSSVDTLSRLLRVRRQSGSSCMNDRDCLADPSLSPPATLVQCFLPSGSSQGECQCSDCFMLNSNGTCDVTLCPDYPYNNNSNVCATDSRPRQLTAFLLTLFVASTGAGNFYIGQDALGGGQLFLLLVITLVPCIMCCLPCCLAICMEKDDVKGSCFFIVIMLVTTLLVIGASLALSAWWIADVIIFATNQRPAGNGCTLTPWG